MSKLWKIYCLDIGDEGWQYKWSDTQITTCPNNYLHLVNDDSIVEVKDEEVVKNFSYIDVGIDKREFTRFTACVYNPAFNVLRRCKLILHSSTNTGTFNIELFDITNEVSLCDTQGNNSENDMIFYTDVAAGVSTSEFILEINVKSSTGKVYINEIMLLSE